MDYLNIQVNYLTIIIFIIVIIHITNIVLAVA